jgi:hypothetical protein
MASWTATSVTVSTMLESVTIAVAMVLKTVCASVGPPVRYVASRIRA